MVNGTRRYPPYVADERTMLLAWLEYHRATLEMKCAGVPAERLAERAVPPSSLSLLGLVRHMAEVERSWFRRRLAGEEAPPRFYSDSDPDGDFDHVEGADVDEAFAAWRAECDHARALVAAAGSLDDVGRRPSRNGEPVSLRWILVHMIEEYARHNGHADLLRERIDGAKGE
jgi:uncharacterized damage-inducible protein DinB